MKKLITLLTLIFVLLGCGGSEKKEKISETLVAQINSEIINNKVIISLDANTPDGAIFETSLFSNVDGIKMITENIVINSGKGKKEFIIPEDWEIGYIGGISMLRFNSEENPQPEIVKKIYGEFGEKLKGNLAVENNLKGYNANLKIESFPYPNKEKVMTKIEGEIDSAFKEIKAASEGSILKIDKEKGNEEISIVRITIIDDWYYLKDFEKERFAKLFGDTIRDLYINLGKAKETTQVIIIFQDVNGEQLATSKTFGGYEIKK